MVEQLQSQEVCVPPSCLGRGLPAFTESAPPKSAPYAHEALHVRQLRRTIGMLCGLVRDWLFVSDWSDVAVLTQRSQAVHARAFRLHSCEASCDDELLALLVANLDAELATQRAARLATWKQKLLQIGPACRYLKHEQRRPLVNVQTVKGEHLAEPCAIDHHLSISGAMWLDSTLLLNS